MIERLGFTLHLDTGSIDYLSSNPIVYQGSQSSYYFDFDFKKGNNRIKLDDYTFITITFRRSDGNVSSPLLLERETEEGANYSIFSKLLNSGWYFDKAGNLAFSLKVCKRVQTGVDANDEPVYTTQILTTANGYVNVVASASFDSSAPIPPSAYDDVLQNIQENADDIDALDDRLDDAEDNITSLDGRLDDIEEGNPIVEVTGTATKQKITLKEKHLNNQEVSRDIILPSGLVTMDDIPTKVSELENDAGYLTPSDINYPVTDVEVNGTSVLDGTVAKVEVPTKVSDLQNDAGYITEIDSSDVTTALGYTPADSASLGTASEKDYTSSVDDSNDLPTATAVKQFVNSSIATNTANFLGTFNIVTDLGLTTSATHEQVAEALETELAGTTVTLNDYVYVAYPDPTVPTQYTQFDRYKASEENNELYWDYEFTLNNSSFTAQQWASINSGITDTLVTQIGTNATDIVALKAIKYGKTLYVNGTTLQLKDQDGTVLSTVTLQDTTYNSLNPAQGGTDVSLVTTGEKYTWNNKSDFSGSYNDLTNKPSLGTASSKDVGTSSGNVPVLDNSGKLDTSIIPEIDYEKLSNVPIVYLNGTQSNPTILYNLSAGVYRIRGYYSLSESDSTVNLISDGSGTIPLATNRDILMFVSSEGLMNTKYLVFIGAYASNTAQSTAIYPNMNGTNVLSSCSITNTSTQFSNIHNIDLNKVVTAYDGVASSTLDGKGKVLTTDNTVSYTPNGDYNPVTKKYVDDNAITDISMTTANSAGSRTLQKTKNGVATDVATFGSGAFKTAGNSAGNIPVLDNNGKLDTSVIPASVLNQMEYKGTFDASTGSTLTGLEKGWYYICSVAGSKNPDGTAASHTYAIGDWAVYNGTSWDKIDNTDAVSSVNGKTGAVQLTASDVDALPSNTSYVSSVNGESGNVTVYNTTANDIAKFFIDNPSFKYNGLPMYLQDIAGKYLTDADVQTYLQALIAKFPSFNNNQISLVPYTSTRWAVLQSTDMQTYTLWYMLPDQGAVYNLAPNSSYQFVESWNFFVDSIKDKQDRITSTNKLDYSLISNTPTIPTNTNQLTNGSNFVSCSTAQTIVVCTQQEYDALVSGGTVSATTIYMIKESV